MGAYECVLAITGKHPIRNYPENGLGWIVGLDNPMIRDIDRPMFEKFLPERYKTKFYKQDNIWECKGDGREWTVVFKSTEMGREKFQGSKIDWAWIDEEPKDPEVFPEIETRLVDRAGPWWITATPLLGTAWLKGISSRDDVYCTFAGMRDNPYLPRNEIEKLARTLTEDERLIRIEGEYVIFAGRPVFDRASLRKLLAIAEKLPMAEEGVLTAA